jgi:parvulin-like peptidyl-prolyl isomerase
MVFAQNDLQTVAMVELTKKEPITVRQLKAELTPREQAAGRTSTVEERRTILNSMIDQRLILQAAERDRITISAAEIDNALRTNLAQQIGRQPTEAEFTQAVQQAGTSVQAIREEARKQLLAEKYLMAKKQTQIQNIKEPTEANITNWYNLYKARDLVRPDTIGVTLISVPVSPDKAKARETADRLTREIDNSPTKFDQVALRGQNPDAVGYVARTTFLARTPEFLQQSGEHFITVAFGLKQGEVSPLLETSDAYHFLKVNTIYPNKILELDDPVSPATPNVTVRQYIRQGLMTEQMQLNLNTALQELITDLRKERNAVTIYDQYINW